MADASCAYHRYITDSLARLTVIADIAARVATRSTVWYVFISYPL